MQRALIFFLNILLLLSIISLHVVRLYFIKNFF